MKKAVRNVTDADTANANMPIYTRTGDSGITGLYGGKRIPKSDLRIEACGGIDELTSFTGLLITKIKNKDDILFLTDIQKDFHQIMAVLSGAKLDLRFLEKNIIDFENKIDNLEKKLPKLDKFILPGGTEISSWFHILRVICRRAERNVVRSNGSIIIIKYLNRLSDLLFVMAQDYEKNKEVVL